MALDQATASSQGYHVGDLIPIVTAEPLRRFRLSGVARLGGVSLGGATFAVFDPATAAGLYGKQGSVDVAYVAGESGVSANTLIAEIQPLLPSELVARTTSGQVDTQVQRISAQLRILTIGLLAFALLAVFVGAFVIFNTFSITVAQRGHEFALLRALGASRGQVLRSVLAEAITIGAIASLAGIALGLLAAAAIRALFAAVGLNLPSTRLVFAPRTAAVSLGVGVLVTVLAGLLPALRATRVAPLEALRESEAPAPATRRHARLTILVAALLAIGGFVLVFAPGGSTTARLERSGGVPSR